MITMALQVGGLALRLLLTISATLVVATQAIPARVLIYSATEQYRHDSIPTAIAALQERGPSSNLQFDATEDRTKFNDADLGMYDAVMFLSTTGEVLDDAGKTAFLNYLKKGGNFVGIHSASDTLVNTTFYGRELGSSFDYHPALQNATVDVIGPSHPSTDHLPRIWNVQDEIYNFKSDPRSVGATVVLAANESSYADDGTRKYDQGLPHPLAWYQIAGAGVSGDEGAIPGRSFYTSLGHLNETWQDDNFMSHVFGGISWVLQGNTTRAANSSGLVGNPTNSSPKSISGNTGGTNMAAKSSTTSLPTSGIRERLAYTPTTSVRVLVVTALAIMFGYLSLSWASERSNNVA